VSEYGSLSSHGSSNLVPVTVNVPGLSLEDYSTLKKSPAATFSIAAGESFYTGKRLVYKAPI